MQAEVVGADGQLVWNINEYIEFSIMVMDLPRGARLCLGIYALYGGKSKSKKKKQEVGHYLEGGLLRCTCTCIQNVHVQLIQHTISLPHKSCQVVWLYMYAMSLKDKCWKCSYAMLSGLNFL